jgi:ligand-binding SRPBCC domain-containing protein
MFFSIQTTVKQDYLTVSRNFGKDLFVALSPPFPPVKLLRFDGNQKGNEVHIELNFLLFRQKWISLITSDYADENEINFVDEGTKTPFFLKYWHHKHRIIRHNNAAIIKDEITFNTPFIVFDWLMFPVMYCQFLYRRPIYKKYFSK